MTQTAQANPAPPTARRVAATSAIGTTIEYYDFIIYGTAAALVFPTVFFPALGAAAGTVASFATYAVAFIARPVGAIIFGHFGDRVGRKQTLISTLLLMGIATFLIGVLPGSAVIGIAAPVILIVLRVLQGLAVGGEWAGAALLAAEYAPARKRGLYGVFPQLGPSIAIVLSSATFLIVNIAVGETSDAFVSWGWRIPFIASAALVLLGLYVRLKVDETPVFQREAMRHDTSRVNPVVSVLKEQPKEVFLGGAALAMIFTFYHIAVAYLAAYGTAAMGLSRSTVLALGIVGGFTLIVVTVLAGMLSDRVGRRILVLASCVISVPWSLSLFTILGHNTATSFAVGMCGLLVIVGIAVGPAGSLLPELFRTEHRYTGAGMAWATAGVIGGGTGPIVATKLTEAGHTEGIGWMLAAYGVLSLVAMLAIPETSKRQLEADNAALDLRHGHQTAGHLDSTVRVERT
ncbi:MFS transporter [Nocardioides sp.]|uniref:MFS transporter n=1 Tax=Nocardioides sp. TaxID=35761 RepID=UPI0035B31305